jgi:hypothetical protein
MSTAVPHRVDMSTFFTSSGILQLNTCPSLCYVSIPEIPPLATSVLGGHSQSAKEMKQ